MHLQMVNTNGTADDIQKLTTKQQQQLQQIDSDNSSNSSEPESRTRIGDDYQANYLIDQQNQNSQNEFKETLLWTPSEKLSDKQIEDYLFVARARYAYNIDQALAMLFWHNHDIEKALNDMSNFVPIPDEWSCEDKVLFEQAFLYQGKNFHKIRTVLPDKTQASLVNYYYMWKKTRNHKSLMDHLQQKNNESESDNEIDYGILNVTNICCNCDDINSELHSTPKGMLCTSCYQYWKRTGVMRPEHVNNYAVMNKTISNKHYNSGSDSNTFLNNNANKESRNILKSFRKPPKGIYLKSDELIELTQTSQNEIFIRLENHIMSLKKQVQSNKQDISLFINQFDDNIDTMVSNLFNPNNQNNNNNNNNSISNTDNNNTNDTNNNNSINSGESTSTSTSTSSSSSDKKNPVCETIKTKSKIISPLWTQRDAELAIQAFHKYNKDFNAIAQIIETKSEDSIRGFYEYHKLNSNLDDIMADKNIVNNADELQSLANTLIIDKNNFNSINKKEKTCTKESGFIQNDDSSIDDVIIL